VACAFGAGNPGRFPGGDVTRSSLPLTWQPEAWTSQTCSWLYRYELQTIDPPRQRRQGQKPYRKQPYTPCMHTHGKKYALGHWGCCLQSSST